MFNFKKCTYPVDFIGANTSLTSGGNENTFDLPVFRDGGRVVSCWRIPFWRRFRVFVTGKIWVCIKGNTHPPLYVETK